MCGIAGVARRAPRPVDPQMLLRMAAALRHRGPDGYGFYAGPGVGLAHTRLSIIDLATGAQPLANEDGSVLVVFNGEIFNYLELRAELLGRGHRFASQTDTEVLVHGYEQWGRGLLERLNGEFAFAIFDRREGSLLLARDRFGIRPLFYAFAGGDCHFASEVKALFASGEVPAAPDATGLDQVFTFWAARAPRTVFAGVRSVEPGGYVAWCDGRVREGRYYELDLSERREEPADVRERLDALLRDAVRLRLRADVPVGGYLSGGLDSSITCALAAQSSPQVLRTFSITFCDPRFDESAFQQLVARQLGSRHLVQPIDESEIAGVFPQVIWHTESPVVRTAPAPMYLLSRLTAAQGIKVVLTGEGADELFLGYDLFKEMELRRFCQRQPGSAWRTRLFDRLYPYLTAERGGGRAFWQQFFLGAGSVDDPLFSHLPRFHVTGWVRDAYGPALREQLGETDQLADLRQSLPAAFAGWSATARAAYLEMTTLLPGYLLSSQGDRMALAHGVEARYPFLDHRLFEFAAALPPSSKLRGLREKRVLKGWAKGVVPAPVRERDKQPYRAPDAPAFFGAHRPEYVEELLAPGAIAHAGLFAPRAVAGLLRRCRAGRANGIRENQALVAVLSGQLWHAAFLERSARCAPLPLEGADVAWWDEGAVAHAPPGLGSPEY
jgi:asparagine synthase (glutamine-hydrolysing)